MKPSRRLNRALKRRYRRCWSSEVLTLPEFVSAEAHDWPVELRSYALGWLDRKVPGWRDIAIDG